VVATSAANVETPFGNSLVLIANSAQVSEQDRRPVVVINKR